MAQPELGCACLLGPPEEARLWCALLEDDEGAREALSGQLAEDGRRRRVLVAAQGFEEAEARKLYDDYHLLDEPLGTLTLNQATSLKTGNASLLETLAAKQVGDATFTVHPHRVRLRQVLRAQSWQSPDLDALCGGSRSSMDLQLRFFAYQLVRCVGAVHARGLALELSWEDLFVTDRLWLEVLPRLWRKEALVREPGDRVTMTSRWIKGDVSNFEYLMELNRSAGRSWQTLSQNHAILPWVTDFSEQGGGWRDLSKSKFRLSRGEAMLDLTFAQLGHHISEPGGLSELACCIYLSRRAPVSVLRRVVRASIVAEHYPASIQRLYEWSPDECIPEFYTDPSVFKSLHLEKHGLPDLGVPSWCSDAEDFIKYHRSLLESRECSSQLHLWIDLFFGVAVQGPAALLNKNVSFRPKPQTLFEKLPQNSAPAKLFQGHHPRKKLPQLYQTPTTAMLHRAELEAFLALDCDQSSRDGELYRKSLRSMIIPLDDTSFTEDEQEEEVEVHASLEEAQRSNCRCAARLIAEMYAGSKLRPPLALRKALEAMEKGDLTCLEEAVEEEEEEQEERAFPTYFKETYDLVSGTVLISQLKGLELAGLLLAMPHLLKLLGGWLKQESTKLAAFVDVVGARLGSRLTARFLVPRSSSYFETFNDNLLLKTLICRGGAAAFCTHVLPALVDCVIKRPRAQASFAAALTLAELARDDMLGPGLTASKVLPPLLASLLVDDAGDEPSARAAAVVAVYRRIGDDPSIVLRPILEPQGILDSSRRKQDVVAVLATLLDSFTSQTVLYYYVRLPSTPLVRLLEEAVDLSAVASFVSLLAMHIGAEATVKYLFPDLDVFFSELNPHVLEPELFAARNARITIARDLLYTPLASMVGVERMRKHVPSASFIDDCPIIAREVTMHRTGVHEALEKGIDWFQQKFQDESTLQTSARAAQHRISKLAAGAVKSPKQNDGMELHKLRDAREHDRKTPPPPPPPPPPDRKQVDASPRYNFRSVVEHHTPTKKKKRPSRRTSRGASSTPSAPSPPTRSARSASTPPTAEAKPRLLQEDDDSSGDEQQTPVPTRRASSFAEERQPRSRSSHSPNFSEDQWPLGCSSEEPWIPKLRVTAPLHRGQGASVLAIDANESVALAGGRDGSVRIWTLRNHPPKILSSWAGSGRAVRSLFTIDGDAVSTDGSSVDIRDLEHGTLVRRWHWPTTNWANNRAIMDLAPLPMGYGAGGPLRSQMSTQQVVALAENGLAIVDVRSKTRALEWPLLFFGEESPPPSSFTSKQLVVLPKQHRLETAQLLASTTKTSPQTSDDAADLRSSHDRSPQLASCVTTCGDGDSLVVVSDRGRALIMDRRVGRILVSWTPHPGSAVLKCVTCGRDELLTVGADRNATLWDMRSNIPRSLATLRNLPDFRGGLNKNCIDFTFEREDDDDGHSRSLTLVSACGHRVATHTFPPSRLLRTAKAPHLATAVKRHFVDDKNQRLHRNTVQVGSLAILPLRKIILLGCEDGLLRAAI